MNTKTVRWMLLVGGFLGSAASAFAAPGLLEIQSKASLFNCNPSSSGCVPLQAGSVSWGAINGWGVPTPPPPPPPPPPHGHPAPWVLSNLLIGDQIANTNAMLAPRNSSPQISLKSLSKGSQFPLENSATKVKFRRDAKTNRYILDFGVIKQTANPVEMKLVLKPIEKKEQVYVADFVFKIDASSPGAFSTELPLRDSTNNPGSLLTIKGVVRGR